MQVNDRFHGFRVLRIRAYAELGGSLIELEHEKTGARLCWLDRPDENKTFSIAFKTLPEDSTGVFHILEHSVLCGSDRYPVKEPFVELLKTSVQTFLNAMTYGDKTVYPVSSRNDRDLLNLMDVYLDAVFHPAIYRRPEIFRQEGWRYEGEGEALCYQGVVFNEMKGAFSSPNTVLYNAMQEMLFPDTCYRHVSGGDPERIPDLTYEQFLASHRRYYHPSNARISLVGSIDPDPVLEKIDSFLSAYDRQPAEFRIPLQRPADRAVREIPFEIGPEEAPEHRAIIAEAAILARFDESLRNYAANVLADYLTGDNEAPLKRAVLNSGLAQDFAVVMEDGTQQSIFGWQAMNTDADQREALEQTVRQTVEQLLQESLDRERLTACFRSFAFRMRDNDNSGIPRSLAEALDMLNTWLYDGDPAEGLLVEETLNALEAKLERGYFEDLLREFFLDDAHTAAVVLVPSRSLGAEKRAREAARLKAEQAAWTEADRDRLRAAAETLRLWQQTPDSPEALAAIPVLQLKDLRQTPEPLAVTRTERAGIPLLRHTVGSELSYFRTHFEVNDLTPEELPVLSALCSLLGSLATRRRSRAALQSAVKSTLGRLDFTPAVFPGSEPDRCRVLLSASAACLKDQAEKAAALLAEILTETVYDDTGLLRDVLQQISVNAKLSLPGNGHRFGLLRLAAGCTAQGLVSESFSGLTFIQWVDRTLAAGEPGLRALLGAMGDLADRLVSRQRLTLSCSETVSEAALEVLLKAFPADGSRSPAEAVYPRAGIRQEGVVIPAQVGYAVTGTNLRLHGRGFTGSIPVLSKLLSFTYLWNEIRVQGGAYGCGFGGRDSGDLFFYTYRDPQPNRSLRIIAGAADFVRGFLAETPDLTGFILSAVSALDPLRNSEAKIGAAETRFFRGISEETVAGYYRQLLDTGPADLLELCAALEELTADNAVCVVAGEALLDACGDSLRERIALS